MKKILQIIVTILIIIIILVIAFLLLANYIFIGSITGKNTCNKEVLNAFESAYLNKNSNYCNYDGPIKLYKNFKGYYSCSIPQQGYMRGIGRITNNFKSECISYLAEALGNTSFCNNQTNPNLKNDCITGVAIATKNPNLCEELKNYNGEKLTIINIEYESCTSLSK